MTQFGVIIEKDDDGYFAHLPALQGCYAQGDTYEEALANVQDAIRLNLEDIKESGQKMPKSHQISLSTIEISV
jgi:predicted RNase H-like HicB family nuclease